MWNTTLPLIFSLHSNPRLISIPLFFAPLPLHSSRPPSCVSNSPSFSPRSGRSWMFCGWLRGRAPSQLRSAECTSFLMLPLHSDGLVGWGQHVCPTGIYYNGLHFPVILLSNVKHSYLLLPCSSSSAASQCITAFFNLNQMFLVLNLNHSLFNHSLSLIGFLHYPGGSDPWFTVCSCITF